MTQPLHIRIAAAMVALGTFAACTGKAGTDQASIDSAAKPVSGAVVSPTGDAVAGESKARRCLACHTFNQGGSHKAGPNLFGLTSRPAGTAAGFNYSAGLGNAGFSWDAAGLAAWVCDSQGSIKQLTGNVGARTSMANQRICGADATSVAAYLETLK